MPFEQGREVARHELRLLLDEGPPAGVDHEGVVGEHVAPAARGRAPAEVVLLAVARAEGRVEAADRVDQRAPHVEAEADAGRQLRIARHRRAREGGRDRRGVVAGTPAVVLAEARPGQDLGVVRPGRDRADARVGRRAAQKRLEPAGRHDRVAVEQHDVAPRERHAAVRRAGEAEVHGIGEQLDARVGGGGEGREQGRDAGIARGVVDEHEAERRTRMREHARDAVAEVVGRVVDRDDDVDGRGGTRGRRHRPGDFPRRDQASCARFHGSVSHQPNDWRCAMIRSCAASARSSRPHSAMASSARVRARGARSACAIRCACSLAERAGRPARAPPRAPRAPRRARDHRVALDDELLAERAELLEVADVAVRPRELAVALLDQPLALQHELLEARRARVDLRELRVALADEPLALGHQRLERGRARVDLRQLAVAFRDQRLALARQRVEPQHVRRLRLAALQFGLPGIGEERQRGTGRRQRRGVPRGDHDEVHRRRRLGPRPRRPGRRSTPRHPSVRLVRLAPERRAEPDPLRVPGARGEAPVEQPREFVAIVLVAVERVHVAARFRVLGPVRRGQHDEPPGSEDARELLQHRRLVGRVEMLDRLERDDEVDAGVLERKRGRRSFDEAQAGHRGVGGARVRDGRRVDVDPDDLAGRAREKRGAVALAAGRVEHAPPGGEARRERVAVDVLVDDLPAHAGDEALAGERGAGSRSCEEARSPSASAAALPAFVSSVPPQRETAQRSAGRAPLTPMETPPAAPGSPLRFTLYTVSPPPISSHLPLDLQPLLPSSHGPNSPAHFSPCPHASRSSDPPFFLPLLILIRALAVSTARRSLMLGAARARRSRVMSPGRSPGASVHRRSTVSSRRIFSLAPASAPSDLASTPARP